MEHIPLTKASSSDQQEETGPISIKDVERDILSSTKTKKRQGMGEEQLQINQMGQDAMKLTADGTKILN